MKYIITQAQRDAILRIPGYLNLKDEIAALKPIEPLSDEQIMGIVANKPFNSAIGFARAIERHITGSAE